MIGADFGECNTTAKSDSLSGSMLDAQTPLNIGGTWRSTLAVKCGDLLEKLADLIAHPTPQQTTSEKQS